MKKLKVFYNIVMVKLGIRHILPSECIKKVILKENNDPLVRVDTDENIIIASRLEVPVYLRKEVYKKLKKVIEELKEYNYKIKLYDAYRSFDDQKASWEKRYNETKLEFPDLSEEELERKTKLKVSKIIDKTNVGGHQTGGAIDITLTDENGTELNMGSKYEEHSVKTPTHSAKLNDEEKQNRFLLFNLLKKYGFVNYPNEWWHFSYGDKMWAAYNFKRECVYGYIEPKKEIEPKINKEIKNVSFETENVLEKRKTKIR